MTATRHAITLDGATSDTATKAAPAKGARHGAPASVSVVIPAYDRADILPVAVESAARQTVPPLEILVVDDASRDATPAVVRDLDERFDVPVVHLRHEVNRGGGAARNTGVSAARGDLVAFLDSDDAWEPEKLARQLDAWAASDDPNRTVVYCRIATVNGWRASSRPARGKAPDRPVGDYLFLDRGAMQTSTMLIPRALALAAPIDPTLGCHQDFHLAMALERAGARFLFLPEALVRYDTSPSLNRISGSPDAGPSLHWLDRYGPWLGDDARTAYRARYLARKLGQSGRLREGLGMVWTARRRGLLTWREASWLTGRILVPHRLQQRLKRSVAGLRRS